MKTNLDCIPCFQRQALQAVRFITDDNILQEQILREVMQNLLEFRWDTSPPEMAHKVNKIVRMWTKVNDPYREVKQKSNEIVLTQYSTFKKMVKDNNDPLRIAIRLAIAGNIIDYGAIQDLDLHTVIQKIHKIVKRKFIIDDYAKFQMKLKNAQTLLFFADNAGEIGFDKLLIETMLKKQHFKRISFVVKGGPIINDATIEDALHIGLDKLPNIHFFTTSNGDLGTGPTRKSEEVKDWIETHDLVLSKGQGNYEGLSEFSDIFFLLIAKCPIIASDIDVPINSIILKYQ